jgi:hypothetical protein
MDNVARYFDLEHSLLILREQGASEEKEECLLEEMDIVWDAMSTAEVDECNRRARERAQS